MKKIICIVLVINSLLIGYSFYDKKRAITNEQSVTSFGKIDMKTLLVSEPLQENLEIEDLKPYEKNDYSITPVKRYRISARILKKEKYNSGPTHEILPLDVALGWNKMSDLKTIKDNHISITQSNRFYFWKIPTFDKITRLEIETNSANVHLSAINDEVQKALNNTKEDDLIYLEGYLVNIKNQKTGYNFISSLTRYDTGPGACEVMLVTSLKKL